MDILLLRFDAPLMSFGGVMVDHHGPTERFPGLSLLAGLFGNALGYRHGDADKLEALQAHIEYAARWDIPPTALLDYHTVDLGQDHLSKPSWTTHGKREYRDGGSNAKFGTHIRHRHYWANGVMTLAVGLSALDNGLSIARLADALRTPARPLFLGRKTCLPAAPLLLGRIEADNVLEVLRHEPLAVRPDFQSLRKTISPLPAGEGPGVRVQACWPAHLGTGNNAQEKPIYDRRDWHNQIHAGRRIRVEGWLELAS